MSTFTLQAGLTLPYYDWLSSGTSITWTTVGQTFVTTDPGEVAELRTRSYLAWDGVVPPTPVVVRSKTVVWDGSNLVAKPNEAGDSPVTLPVVAASQLDTDAAMAANSDARAATQKATKTALGLKLDASNLDLASPTPNAPFVYDSIAGKLVPAAKTITKSSGFAEMRVGYSTGATGWAAVNATRPIHLDNNYQVTDITNPLQNSVQGITSTVQFGTGGSSPVAAMGTVHNFSARFVVAGSGDPQNEHAAYFGYIRYENGSRGRTWFTDWNVHGPVAVQPKRLVGITMFMGNYYNGPPEDTPSAGQWIVTRQGSGGGAAAEHTAATTYSINTGLGIIGHSGAILGNGGAGVGFDKALQIGDGGAWGVLGGQDGSRIGTGIDLSDFLNFGLRVRRRHTDGTGPAITVASGAGALVVGAEAPLSTNNIVLIQPPGNADPAVAIHALSSSTSHVTRISNGGGSMKLFVAGAASAVMTGVAAGDTGIVSQQTGKSTHLGGAGGAVLSFSADSKLGFFGTAPVARPALTYSRAGETPAQAQLRSAFSALGLLLDSTTA